jgi:hypothetical protein
MPISAISASTSTASALVQEVDFPTFVTGLIQGVFDANVHACVEQMHAYGDLTAEASASVGHARVDLDAEGAHPDPSDAPRRLAHDRQPLLSTMALMGINRIVVTDGKARG